MLPGFIDTVKAKSVICYSKDSCTNSASEYNGSVFIDHSNSVAESGLWVGLRLWDYLLHYILYF